MRGNSEDVLIPRRGEKGDDFWRRFSVVAHDEKKGKPSVWLSKTQSGTNTLARWVWCVGLIILLTIVCASVLGWWVTRSNNSHRDPTSFGGGASEQNSATAATSTGLAGAVAGGDGFSAPISSVHPTFTVNNRRAFPSPTTAIKRHARRSQKVQL
jgi:hypothetical protein